MKKSLLVFACSCIISLLSAQGNFTITDSTGNHAGTTMTFMVPANSTDTRIYTVTNNNTGSVNIKVRKTVLQLNDAGATTWFCTDLLCYAPTTTMSGNLAMGGNGGTFDLTIDFAPNGVPGVTEVRYTIINQSNTSDTSYITMLYNVTPTGIPTNSFINASISNPMPNPASAMFSMTYKLGSIAPVNTKLVVYNMLGAVVMENEILSAEGVVRMDVSTLGQGVYFCTLVADNKTLATRRLVVSH